MFLLLSVCVIIIFLYYTLGTINNPIICVRYKRIRLARIVDETIHKIKCTYKQI